MIDPSRIERDAEGWPILLANVPNAGTARIDPNASSGNDAHDVRSGKFAPKGNKAQPPANVDPAQYQRMLAAARDAAREFDTPDEGDIREFLAGRAQNAGEVDIPAFLQAVRQERLNDMADLLDNQFRSSGAMRQGRRKVRVTAPRGFIRKAVKDLQPAEVDLLINIITSRGHAEEDVRKFFADKEIGNSSEK